MWLVWSIAIVGLLCYTASGILASRPPKPTPDDAAAPTTVNETRIETGDQSPVVQGVETEDLVIEYGSKSTEADDQAGGGSEP